MTVRGKRRSPRRRVAPRWTMEEWQWANQLLAIRAGGRCERCGVDLTDGSRSVNRHHRQRREVGGDRLANILLLCGSGTTGCHGHVTVHPEEAVANGWSVKALGGTDPALVPVRINGRLWLLDDAGGRRLIP